MAVRRYDTVRLDAGRARRREADGALIVPGRFARSGIQTYHDATGSEVVELRPLDTVRASAPAFDGITVTDRHPEEFVSPSNWAALSRGHMQSTRVIEPASDSEDLWLEADLVIQHGGLADAIERRERSELSAGYWCEELDSPGEYRGQRYHRVQDQIVPNHVAALGPGEARAGRGARMMLDSSGHQVAGKGKPEMTDEEIARLVAERDTLQARADALVGERDQLKTRVAELEDPARRETEFAARLQLTEQARRIAGPTFDASGSDPVAIRRRALEAIGRKLDGRSDAYVEAAFDLALEAAPAQTIGAVMDSITAGAQPANSDPMQALYDARDRAIAEGRA